MCVTVRENTVNEEQVGGRDVDVRTDLQTGFVLAFAQYVTKT